MGVSFISFVRCGAVLCGVFLEESLAGPGVGLMLAKPDEMRVVIIGETKP